VVTFLGDFCLGDAVLCMALYTHPLQQSRHPVNSVVAAMQARNVQGYDTIQKDQDRLHHWPHFLQP